MLILYLVTIAAVAVLGVYALVRNRVLAGMAGFIITELVILIQFNYLVAGSSDAPELVGVPMSVAVIGIPIILPVSIGSAYLGPWLGTWIKTRRR